MVDSDRMLSVEGERRVKSNVYNQHQAEALNISVLYLCAFSVEFVFSARTGHEGILRACTISNNSQISLHEGLGPSVW